MNKPETPTLRRRLPVLTLLLALLASAGAAQVPEPSQSLGFRPGDDYKLADYAQIVGYFRALDAASDRVVVREMGTTAEGRPTRTREGMIQPTKDALRAVRGENSIYHNNAIQTWHVRETGEAENVEVS